METKKQTTAKNVKNSNNEKNVIDEILNSKNLMNDENLLNLDLENLDTNNFDLLVNQLSVVNCFHFSVSLGYKTTIFQRIEIVALL